MGAMRRDILLWADGVPSTKVASKETLNHPDLIERVSGLDPHRHTPEAYRRSYQALGIDIINRVPLQNAPRPTPEGTTRRHSTKPYNIAHLGVYDTVMRHTYACATVDDVWDLDMETVRYEDLLTPVPHPCIASDIRLREEAIGDIGLYYPMLYTTLFMWAVEVLGWEIFLMAAALSPRRFHDHFLLPCVAKSKAIVAAMARASKSPFVFVHDDLASAAGPVFRPRWYDEYVFPHYPEIWAEAKSLGKRVIFVADGNVSAFLPRLLEVGVDGLMFDTPATPLQEVIEHFGDSGRCFIGGIDTSLLAFGSPEEVRRMVLQLHQHAGDYPGFAIASGGGLHGGIPMRNLEAYFDARGEIGATRPDWRTCCRADPEVVAED